MSKLVAVVEFVGLALVESCKKLFDLKLLPNQIIYGLTILFLIYNYFYDQLSLNKTIYTILTTMVSLLVIYTVIIIVTMFGWIAMWHSIE